MAEDEIITLTCFQGQGEIMCNEGAEWQEIGWLNTMVENQKIRLVDRYTRGSVKLYQITSTDGLLAWYHCDGSLICDARDGCSVSAKDLTNQVTIFVAHR
jgi:hypothetical protein